MDTPTLKLDLVLDNERVLLVVDLLRELCGDGVVGSGGLCHEALVAFNDDLGRVLDLPFADVAEGFAANRSLLCGLGGRPPLGPLLGELLEEGGLDRSRLEGRGT